MIKSKKYEHIIWDWNGTLLDDVWLSIKSINKVLKRYSLNEITIKSYLEMFSFPVINYYSLLGFDLNKHSFKKIGTEFISEYSKNQLLPKLHLNSKNILKKIKESKIKQSIVSAAEQNMLDVMVDHHGIVSLFNNIIGQDNHYAYGKEHKLKELIKLEKILPENVLYIGDTIHDFQISDKLNIDCILLSHGHTSYDRLLETQARVFLNLNDLYGWLKTKT